MNYSKDIKRSIEYIATHIKEDLTIQMVARHAGYSLYHFCRVFQVCMGVPVMEYVRKRRLALAAKELHEGKRILDIAMAFGFETQGGFTKAFRKEFGYSPGQYALRMARAGNNLVQPTIRSDYGGYSMIPTFITKPSFKVAGYGITTHIADGSFTKDIAAFWNSYDTNGWETKMYDQLNPPRHGEVGICVPESKDSDHLVYLLGVIVEDFSKVTPDMITLEVPEATYAVFTTPPVDVTAGGRDGEANQQDFPNAIRATWKYIFEEWFPESGYVYDESKLDFEFYDERCHFRPDTVMDIYVPVNKKA
ncbi:AraC family transcriptional regulator ['Paenibacillus yunnanensis' Narsing Rao et al. 2020]|uniref:AraC family transcriptional regulator n=1 Tax=Paenibacillus tengchongensis TaxID=2608684 RepID=UPI00124CD34A|nr:AraC family transcriptional regulator [Paenibacillus tengchongensis]